MPEGNRPYVPGARSTIDGSPGVRDLALADVPAISPQAELRFMGIENNVSILRTDVDQLHTRVGQLDSRLRIAVDGAAVAMAMAGVTHLEAGERYAVSANWGFFDSANAFAFSGAARINSQVSFNGALGVGADTGKVGARAGLRFGW